MKAIVYTEYGPPDVLQLKEIPKPVPAENELLVNVRATSVTAGDYRMRGFDVPPAMWLPARLTMGVRGPRKTVAGIEFSGIVEATGSAVTAFAGGDEVFGAGGSGAYAEYLTIAEDRAVVKKPAGITFEEAAGVPFGSVSALYFLRDQGHIQSGQKVLINGASGGVGTAAVQIAKHYGAEVTGVCSTANLEMVRSLGADAVIDYTSEDFTNNGETYDIIFDTVGKTSFSACERSLTSHGIFAAAVFGPREIGQMLWTKARGDKKVKCGVASNSQKDLRFVNELIEAGEYRTVIDRSYPLEQVAEAHRYAQLGHKKGNVIITLKQDGDGEQAETT